jgi:hypothetical protein
MLRNNDLRAVVSADDAGGQYPALQTEGKKLQREQGVGMSR